jgi:integrase/recombinase XerD
MVIRITNALDAGVPLRDDQVLARHGRRAPDRGLPPGPAETLDRHGAHRVTAYGAGV